VVAAAAAAAVGPPAAAVQLQAPVPELSFAERAGMWDPDCKLQLKNLTIEELQEWCESLGECCVPFVPL
jgi:23S rRNA (adenine2503-C2)-methyltransferase